MYRHAGLPAIAITSATGSRRRGGGRGIGAVSSPVAVDGQHGARRLDQPAPESREDSRIAHRRRASLGVPVQPERLVRPMALVAPFGARGGEQRLSGGGRHRARVGWKGRDRGAPVGRDGVVARRHRAARANRLLFPERRVCACAEWRHRDGAVPRFALPRADRLPATVWRRPLCSARRRDIVLVARPAIRERGRHDRAAAMGPVPRVSLAPGAQCGRVSVVLPLHRAPRGSAGRADTGAIDRWTPDPVWLLARQGRRVTSNGHRRRGERHAFRLQRIGIGRRAHVRDVSSVDAE